MAYPILDNLRSKFPEKATYRILTPLEVFPEPFLDPTRLIGIFPKDQTISVDAVIIIPEKLWPDWWVWGCLSGDDIPKYVCLRKPTRNIHSNENVILEERNAGGITQYEVDRLREILVEMLGRMAT